MPAEHGNFPPTNFGGSWCLCMSDRLLTAVLLQMSSCSTWKHHLFGPNSCCSESTNTLCEGHERGNLLHLHTKITHALFNRLEIGKTSLSEFPGTSLFCMVYMTVCIDIQKTAHTHVALVLRFIGGVLTIRDPETFISINHSIKATSVILIQCAVSP